MEQVKLSQVDLDTLIDVFQRVVDFKQRTLQRHNWRVFESQYLPQLIDYIRLNQFPINDYSNSVFHWIIDQICHSHRLTPGLRPRDGLPLADTALGEQAIEICRRASRGQISYDCWRHNRQFKKLFT